jgi:hypothetical protein
MKRFLYLIKIVLVIAALPLLILVLLACQSFQPKRYDKIKEID